MALEVTMQDQGGWLVEAIGATVLKLYEIWQVEGKWYTNPNSRSQASPKFRQIPSLRSRKQCFCYL